MAQHRVLVTTSYLEPGGEIDRLLADAGCDVTFCRPQDRQQDGDLVTAMTGVQAIIAGNDQFTPEMLSAAPELQIIARTGAGFDAIHLPTADELGITVCNTPGANQRSVAELTVGLILNCARGIAPSAQAVTAGVWKQKTGTELAGTSLGIVGLGSIGQEVALLAAAFGMKILAFDITPDPAFVTKHHVDMCTLPELLQRSDFVTIHVALTDQTRYLLRADTLALMKPTAYLINTSRGGVIDESDLAEALAQGQLAGAALDVLESEPPAPGHPLVGAPGVVITPHIAGATAQARALSSQIAASQILDFFAGKPVAHRVNQPSARRLEAGVRP